MQFVLFVHFFIIIIAILRNVFIRRFCNISFMLMQIHVIYCEILQMNLFLSVRFYLIRVNLLRHFFAQRILSFAGRYINKDDVIHLRLVTHR